MMTDIFKECRERVSAEDAARFYGLTFNRKGWALCPFHLDTHPSMSFKAGRFRCWACNASGDSINLVGRLFGLRPIAAVERLNADFVLNLPLHQKTSPEAMQAARHRKEIAVIYREYENWRGPFIAKLNACFREGHLAMNTLETPADLERLTDAQSLAIREQARIEWLSDTLSYGTMKEQMEIFREKRYIEQLCEKILNHTQKKSGAA